MAYPKGRPQSPEAIEKMKRARQGRTPALGMRHTEQWKAELAEKMRGNRRAQGLVHTAEHRRYMSERIKAEKNPNYVDGLHYVRANQTAQQRKNVEYKLWRDTIFRRDNFTCQLCQKRGGILNADHIKPWAKYPALRYNLANGRTLCAPCHKNVTWPKKEVA